MTEKLYYNNAYLSEFEATVLSCEPEKDGNFAAVLDRTAFFPTGGGQSCDTGTLDGQEVFDVYEKNGVVFHIIPNKTEIGKTVFGAIDFARRFSFMQNHSGEHILSGIIHKKHGYSNVGFHMGSDFVTVDFDGPMTDGEIRAAEEAANAVIVSNAEILTYFPSQKELAAMDYRSKKELSGNVRIVEIPSVDLCACCGTHVKKTGEIGLLKVVDSMNYKGGVRLFILSGKRALEDYSRKNAEIYRVGKMLSRKPEETAEGVEKLLNDISESKYAYSLLWRKYVAEKMKNTSETEGILFLREDGADNDSLRELALSAAEKCLAAVVVSQDKNGVSRYVAASKKTDARIISRSLCEKYSGKGGGKEALCQGTLLSGADIIEEFIHTNTLL